MAIGIPVLSREFQPLVNRLRRPRWIWSFVTETGVEVFGQFFPENLGLRDIGAVWNETTGLGQDKPRIQWTGGKLKAMEFDALFFLEIKRGNLQNVLDTFDYLVNKDDKLLRPPTGTFTYGLNINFECIVEEITNVQLSEVKKDGRLRSIRAHFKLREYVPFDFEESGAPINGETRFVHARDGDTYEHLAEREYGDALKGEVLRQRGKAVVDIEPNDVVALLDPDHPDILKTVQTQSIPLQSGSEEAITRGFERRGGQVVIL